MTENNQTNFSHLPVLLDETVSLLNIKPDGIYVDCTTGGGGHSFHIAEKLEFGRLIAIDRDTDALAAAGQRLKPFADKVTYVHDNYSNLSNILKELGIEKVDGILADLGVSSYQLDTAERGFSYSEDAPLDMRMDRENPFSAYEVVNGYSESELRRIIFDFGEERYARNIASKIIRAREEKPIERTGELAELIKSAMPKEARSGGHHPAKRTFQAIRIEVNSELSGIPLMIDGAVNSLKTGGRIAVITFHSLEDRIVKQAFQSYEKVCTCPKDFPICVCGNVQKLMTVNKKPIVAGENELETNPRARSAKLRVAERI